MVCVSVVLYLMVRALPRIAEEPQTEDKHSMLDRWARSQIPEKVDATLNGYRVKFLRRVRVLVLRLDNGLSKRLQKAKPEDNDKRPNIDFKEIAGQNKESENGQ